MIKFNKKFSLPLIAVVMITANAFSQNPFIQNQYTADPSARVFGDKVYVFPSHDILATEGKGRVGWFCMEDYHVFSSSNMVDWTDHGIIVTQNKVPWVRPDSYSMWAPDCIERNGKYYFYFPTAPKDTTFGRGFTIGVAISNKPEGPYTPEPLPIRGVRGIDPNVFIDKDGTPYLYWSQREIFVAKLKDNMTELDGEVFTIPNLPNKGLKEGPYVFERNGNYYLTYPHVENKIERLEYAMGKSPTGPFTVTGVIMDESPTGCWTNHHSMVQFKGQWYLFYHHNDLSPKFDKNRSIRVDSLSFNDDGTIKKVIPTLRGVGLTKSSSPIQIDRYSSISDQGSSIAFLDTLNRFEGWKAVLNSPKAWVKYNGVQFDTRPKMIKMRVSSATGGTILVQQGGTAGSVASVKIPKGNGWATVTGKSGGLKSGIHDLVVTLEGGGEVAIDWISFE